MPKRGMQEARMNAAMTSAKEISKSRGARNAAIAAMMAKAPRRILQVPVSWGRGVFICLMGGGSKQITISRNGLFFAAQREGNRKPFIISFPMEIGMAS
jgi:hypothetical protein